MSSIPSLFELCANNAINHPEIQKKINDSGWRDSKWLEYQQSHATTLNALDQLAQKTGSGKKIVLLAKMGIVDPRKIVWWDPAINVETMLTSVLYDFTGPFPNSGSYFEHFQTASLALRYSIFEDASPSGLHRYYSSTQEKLEVMRQLPPDVIQRVKYFLEHKIRNREGEAGAGSLPKQVAATYGLHPAVSSETLYEQNAYLKYRAKAPTFMQTCMDYAKERFWDQR